MEVVINGMQSRHSRDHCGLTSFAPMFAAVNIAKLDLEMHMCFSIPCVQVRFDRVRDFREVLLGKSVCRDGTKYLAWRTVKYQNH